MTASILNLEQMTTGYAKASPFIRNLDLRIPQGKISTLIGSNGAGKTTLLKCMMGILPSFEGRIVFNGDDITRAKSFVRSHAGMAYVPQGRFIFPLLTVEENLLIGVEVRKMNTRKAKDMAYGFFPDLAGIAHRKGGMLSGGQQQQLALARVLVLNPQLLILDEPSEGIQPNIVQHIGRIIKQVNQQLGTTVLLVEQFVEFAIHHADHLFMMEHGEITRTETILEENEKALIGSISI